MYFAFLPLLTNWEMIKGGAWISFHRMPHKIFERETLNYLMNNEVIHSLACWGVSQKSESDKMPFCGKSHLFIRYMYKSLWFGIYHLGRWNVNIRKYTLTFGNKVWLDFYNRWNLEGSYKLSSKEGLSFLKVFDKY